MQNEVNVQQLEERLSTVVSDIGRYSPGTEEYDALQNEMNILTKALNDQQKLDLDASKLTYEGVKDTVEEKERTLDRWLRTGLEVLKIGVMGLGSVLTWKAFKLGLAFETEGTFRSKTAMEGLKRVLTAGKIIK